MGKLFGWLAGAVVVTIVFAAVYAVFQQEGRRAANDAPAAAAAMGIQLLGTYTEQSARTELTESSGLFVLVYSADGKPVSGTATLNHTLPQVPDGVLQTARTSGTDAVTWQPEPGLRFAIVARSSSGRVVVAGQSLSPYEDRDRMAQLFLGLGWLACMVVFVAGSVLGLVAGRSRRS